MNDKGNKGFFADIVANPGYAMAAAILFIPIVAIFLSLFRSISLQTIYAKQPETILVTGFESFNNIETNGSWEAVRDLDGKYFGTAVVVAAKLPVVWDEADKKLHELIRANNPVAIISFGQTAEKRVMLEEIAHNVRENIYDNSNKLPNTLQVYEHGAFELETGLPLSEIKSRLQAASIPVQKSKNAGTYLCNDIFYTLMYDPGTANAKDIPRGFVHVPPLDESIPTRNGNTVTFDKDTLQKSAAIIIQAVIDASQIK